MSPKHTADMARNRRAMLRGAAKGYRTFAMTRAQAVRTIVIPSRIHHSPSGAPCLDTFSRPGHPAILAPPGTEAPLRAWIRVATLMVRGSGPGSWDWRLDYLAYI